MFKSLLSNEDYKICMKHVQYDTQYLKDIQNEEKIVSEESIGIIIYTLIQDNAVVGVKTRFLHLLAPCGYFMYAYI